MQSLASAAACSQSALAPKQALEHCCQVNTVARPRELCVLCECNIIEQNAAFMLAHSKHTPSVGNVYGI
jgi:hypothetical protein